jgi:predicted HNH restriction endonuclease
VDSLPKLASISAYVAALSALAKRGISPADKAMLVAHYAMPDYVATMRHMSAALGLPHDHKQGNLRYGQLAARVRRELGLDYHGLALWTLATFPEEPVDELEEFSFRMRPEVARALEKLGWVDGKGERHTAKTPTAARQVSVAPEGDTFEALRLHRRREKALREAKIAAALAESFDGRLLCEVPRCGFDFVSKYGEEGRGYIQVHHLKPIGERNGAEKTTLDDLALVCPNCHAMIHVGGRSRSLDEIVRPDEV